MSENLSRAERRKQKREISRLKKLEQSKAAKKSSFFTTLFVVVIIGGIFTIWYLKKTPEVPSNEVKVPIMGREHATNTDKVTYNSNPATSGPHFPDWHKEWKFYDTELPIGGLLHNMEHGGIVLFYKSSIDETTKAQLKNFTEDNFKVIAGVNEDIPAPIALAAWGVYELFDTFNEAGMKQFYKKHLNRGPENVYP